MRPFLDACPEAEQPCLRFVCRRINRCCWYLQWLLPKLGPVPTTHLSQGKGLVSREELLPLCPFAVTVTAVTPWTSLYVVKSHRNRPLDWLRPAGFEVSQSELGFMKCCLKILRDIYEGAPTMQHFPKHRKHPFCSYGKFVGQVLGRGGKQKEHPSDNSSFGVTS